MKLQWPVFKHRASGWTAVDTAPDGRLVGVSVRPPRFGGDRPQVLRCGQSMNGRRGGEALADLARKLVVPASPWVLTLQRGDYQMLVVDEPPVPAAEMAHSLRWSLGTMVEYPVEEASIDWMRIPTEEFQPSRARRLYAVVAREALVNERAALFQKARLNLRAVDVRETALRNIAALLEQSGEGLGLLSMGPSGITATFSFQGELYLDRFIEQPMDELLQADEPARQRFLERVALQVSRSVDFIGRNFSFMPVGRIVVAPMPAALPLLDYLAQSLAVRVEALDLAGSLDLTPVPELAQPEAQARYLIALGAALRGMRKTT